MGSTNKELLGLEHRGSSTIESRLLVCKNDLSSRQGNLHPNKNGGEKPLTTPVPTSQVLGRVKNFLGVMAEANEKLMREAKEKPLEAFDIEALTGNEEQYIEMDLRLGIVDLYTPEAVAAAESAVAGAQMALSEPVSPSDTDDSDDDEIVGHPALSESPLSEDESERSDKKRKRPKITEL
ncbi:uncharacterized protein LOC116250637 [Nymphaea colorata]|nr:uncharacterized protein LOC116250637 [Nymphaea colorata]XP_031480281.1 uncharacterized protein LOC116250637 [Nymphaea colorata]